MSTQLETSAAATKEGLLDHLRALYAHRELLLIWAGRDVKIRYKQSLLGAAWAILQPLSMMIIFTVVFSLLVRVPSDGIPYPLFSYAALLPWTLLATSISLGAPSLVNNMNLVTKIYFPREILPVAAVLASLVDFLVASLIFVAMMAYYRVSPSVTMLAVPALLAVQIVLIAGVVLLASALNVFYRDIRFLVPLLIQLWMYATPVIYPTSVIPERYRPFYMLNPMASLIEGYRKAILFGQWPEVSTLIMAAAVSIGLLLVAYRYFKAAEPMFADLI